MPKTKPAQKTSGRSHVVLGRQAAIKMNAVEGLKLSASSRSILASSADSSVVRQQALKAFSKR